MITPLIITFIVCLLLDVPVAFALGIAAVAAVTWAGFPLSLVVQQMTTSVDSFVLLAVPLFILAGHIMAYTGLAHRVIDFCESLFGFIRGGLAQVNIGSSMFFGGITGAAVADTAAIGSVLIPPMIRKKYDAAFTTAVTAASSTIGVIIPPSIPLILVGVITGASVSKLFLAGIIPGLLIGIAMMLTAYVICRRHHPVKEGGFLPREVWSRFIASSWALMLPVIIIGGILSGVFTPTEAAVIAVLYAFAVGKLVMNSIRWRDLPALLIDSAKTTGIVMLMVATASLYGWILTREGVPADIGAFISDAGLSPFSVILGMIVIYILAGTILDLSANIIILVPVLYPLAQAIGLDPLVFGVMTVMSLALGLVTPPVGVCLFVACGISEVSILAASRAVLPFIAAFLGVLALILVFPQLVLFLPGLGG